MFSEIFETRFAEGMIEGGSTAPDAVHQLAPGAPAPVGSCKVGHPSHRARHARAEQLAHRSEAEPAIRRFREYSESRQCSQHPIERWAMGSRLCGKLIG